MEIRKENEWEIFSQNIKKIRKEQGLSKKSMAKRLKIGIQSLNKIENGELPPRLSVQIFFEIYKEFHIHPKDQFQKK